jgi:hypothetical protein
LPHKQLDSARNLGRNPGGTITLTNVLPDPALEEPWKKTELSAFDRRMLGPYDLLFQILRNTVQYRTLDSRAARLESGEPPLHHWWHTQPGFERVPF